MAEHTNESSRRAALGATGKKITVDGVDVAFDDEGRGPAVVCLHAIGHGASDFERLRGRLSVGNRVLALDWPGHGNSGQDRVPACARRYAELLDGFLDSLGVDRVVLVGNSIGGAASLLSAAARPERVHALVLENPGGLAPTTDRAARVVLSAMARFFAAGARGARWFPAAFSAYYRFCVLPGRTARAQRDRITAAAYESAPVLEQAWRSFAAPEADLRAIVPQVTCPVLFAWAKRDQFVSLDRSLPAIERFPSASLERFRATHAAHLEAPDAFETTVERFLAELGWREVSPVGNPRDAQASSEASLRHAITA